MNNSKKQVESTLFKREKKFKRFETRIRSFGEKDKWFVKKTDSFIGRKRNRKRILRSTSKFQERIGKRKSRDERRKSRFMPGLT